MISFHRILAVVLALCAGTPDVQAAGIESRPVTFARGASSATIAATLKGDQTIDYKLRARAGQTMTVEMKTSHAAAYFNVLPPGSNDVALFVGSSGGSSWSDRLPSDGEYKIRVYLMRRAARRNEAARFTLTVAVAADRASTDAKVAGTPYHATGEVPCSLGRAAPGSARCAFGVIRGTSGNAEVHVTPPGGARRVLRFEGNAVSAEGAGKVAARKNGDDWIVDVDGREQYRIPEAVISGG